MEDARIRDDLPFFSVISDVDDGIQDTLDSTLCPHVNIGKHQTRHSEATLQYNVGEPMYYTNTPFSTYHCNEFGFRKVCFPTIGQPFISNLAVDRYLTRQTEKSTAVKCQAFKLQRLISSERQRGTVLHLLLNLFMVHY